MRTKVAIRSVSLGFCQCYVLRGDGLVVVDAGAPGKWGALLRLFESEAIRPDELKLLILTHGHWDHVGSAADIKSATGAKIAMHRKEVSWLENSLKPLSPGVGVWGKILTALHRPFMPLINFPAAKVDLVLGDEPFPLEDFGIPGQIIHTPGHSPGSVSLLLESGEAFVGDLAMNRFPLRLSPGLPIFADQPSAGIKSWNLLMDLGAKLIYPAHGKPFPSSIIADAISRPG